MSAFDRTQEPPATDVNGLNGQPELLRQAVREVLAEVLPTLISRRQLSPDNPDGGGGSSGGSSGSSSSSNSSDGFAYPSSETMLDPRIHPIDPHHRAEPWVVRLDTDDELRAFVLRVIKLADNPKRRRDLISGRARFTLARHTDRAPAHRADSATAHRADDAPARRRNGATSHPADRAAQAADGVTHPADGAAYAGPGSAAQRARHGAAPTETAAGAPSPVHRVDKGAVTERAVVAAAAAGSRLVLGPRAVLTPLARDKARALGVPIEKER